MVIIRIAKTMIRARCRVKLLDKRSKKLMDLLGLKKILTNYPKQVKGDGMDIF